MALKLTSKEQLHHEIEEIVWDKDISYIEAVIDYCETHDIDESDIAKSLTSKLKSNIAIEAENLNYLPKTNRLPIDTD
jgi:hypothetical protein